MVKIDRTENRVLNERIGQYELEINNLRDELKQTSDQLQSEISELMERGKFLTLFLIQP